MEQLSSLQSEQQNPGYIRHRKNFRLTNFCTHRLRVLSGHYDTSEAAMVEAAVNQLYMLYLDEVMNEPGDYITPAEVREGIESAVLDQAIGASIEAKGES